MVIKYLCKRVDQVSYLIEFPFFFCFILTHYYSLLKSFLIQHLLFSYLQHQHLYLCLNHLLNLFPLHLSRFFLVFSLSFKDLAKIQPLHLLPILLSLFSLLIFYSIDTSSPFLLFSNALPVIICKNCFHLALMAIFLSRAFIIFLLLSSLI